MTSALAVRLGSCLLSAMARIYFWFARIAAALLVIGSLTHSAFCASKPHVVSLGKWITVQWPPGEDADNNKPLAVKVRPLLVDTRVKEFTLGPAHEVTERLFVVRRAFRVNDSLPQESSVAPRWKWERDGWLLVDRVTGRVTPVNLPEFDALYSAASWYRDYAAYCGVSDDGRKVFAVVAQISRRKPLLKKPLDGASIGEAKEAADSACPMPAWDRSPTRVTFEPAGVSKQTFAIRGHTADLIAEDEDEEAAK